MKDKNAWKISKPILIEEYTYRLKLDDNGISIKAKKENNPSRYLCFITPNSIEGYKSLNGITVLYHTINNLLIEKSSSNNDNNGDDGHFTVKYDVEQDRIIMKLIMGYNEIEDTFIWRLEKTSAIEKRKKLKYYNILMEDHKELVEKVRKSGLYIIAMQQDPDIMDDIKKIKEKQIEEEYSNYSYDFNENSECPRYMVDVNCYEDGIWNNKRFDVRDIQKVLIFHNPHAFSVCIVLKNIRMIWAIRIDEYIDDDGKQLNPLFPKNKEEIKNKKYLEFLNKFTDYEGYIATYGIYIFDFIDKCKKIKGIVLDNCDEDLDMLRVMNFPELESLEITEPKNIYNIEKLQQKHNSLKFLKINNGLIKNKK